MCTSLEKEIQYNSLMYYLHVTADPVFFFFLFLNCMTYYRPARAYLRKHKTSVNKKK